MQKKSTFRELLLSPDKKKGESTNFLATLFRDALITLGVTPSEWDMRVDRYYRRRYTNAAGEVDKKRVDQEKSNLTRALTKDRLPPKRFEEGMAVLGAESILMTMQVNYPRGYKNNHKVLVRYSPTILPDDDEDEDEEEDDAE